MYHPIITCFFLLAFWVALKDNSPLYAQPSPHLKKHIDRIVNEQLNTLNPPFGVAICVIDENYPYHFFYGELTPNQQNPPDSTTLFALNAIGKLFATTVYAAMAAEDRLLPTSPITRYLPDSVAQNPYLQTITLQHLATHTAGLSKNPTNAAETALDAENLLGNYQLQDLYAYLQNYKPLKGHSVGTFSYSHTGICLLSVILETIAQQPFAQLLQKYVFVPTNMPQTTARPDTLYPPPNIAIGQTFGGSPTQLVHLQLMANVEGLYSNLNNMQSFLQTQMTATDSTIIGQTHRAHSKTPTKWVKAATGWFVVSEGKNGPHILTHSGRAGGYSSYIGFEKSRKVGVVVLSNSARRCDEIGISIMELLLR